NFKEWQELTQLVIDPSKLNDSQYLNKIRTEVGAENIAYIIAQTKLRQKYYEEAKVFEEAAIEDDLELTKDQKKNRLAIWEAKYDPVVSANQKGAKDVQGTTVWPSSRYAVSVPRKINTRGEALNYYDENFKTIQKNPALKEFHDYSISLLEELNSYTPYTKDPVNTIPIMQMTFMEAAKSEDVHGVLNLAADAIRKSQRAKGALDTFVTDEFTEGRMLSSNLNIVMKRQRAAQLEVKMIDYRQKNKKNPTEKMIEEWKADI
ncbi:unnamed protein product, partial [marine sediment metagenome]